jgi:hypothetical protein
MIDSQKRAEDFLETSPLFQTVTKLQNWMTRLTICCKTQVKEIRRNLHLRLESALVMGSTLPQRLMWRDHVATR